MAERHGIELFWPVFANRIEVNRDAEGCAGLVLSAVSAADGSAFIVEDIHDRSQRGGYLLGLFHQCGLVFQKRKNAALDRCHAGMETEDGASLGVSFFICDCFLVEGLTKEGECGAVNACAWFHDMWYESFFGCLVEVVEWFARVFDVFSEIVVGTVGDALEFTHSKWEFVFQVVGFF